MNPYATLEDHAFWRKAVSSFEPWDIDPIVESSLRMNRTTKIATAGSCFAQRIAHELKERSFNYFVTETHTNQEADAGFYELFSAAYGNIYTTRQLYQLMQRAFGLAQPRIDHWINNDGRYVDAFRPGLCERGFESLDTLEELRKQHFRSVRKLFQETEVFIFTLGLTEIWRAEDGFVAPVIPGVAGCDNHSSQYGFYNLSVAEMSSDLLKFMDDLRALNPKVEVLLTVSPVSIIATYEDRHVVVSNAYTKSALRVVAEEAILARQFIHYLPSYEIVTSPATKGVYLDDDRRKVNADGIDVVMSQFSKHYLSGELESSPPARIKEDQARAPAFNSVRQAALQSNWELEELVRSEHRQIAKIVCDEEMLDRV